MNLPSISTNVSNNIMKRHIQLTHFFTHQKKTKQNNFVTKIYIKCGFKFDHNMIIELLKVYLLY